uniref:Reverse transcriptase domain-containing protein n=1 Tax=Tanacetum cinerariifolium TaxID=118510 RepID=A0A6L2KCP9_TANCI|nr:reverse transcriptase domain-containing protein [Tanacetum cinerariifolium]
MDDEPMWVAGRVVTLTPGSAITIPETANEFVIKVVRVKKNQLNLGVGTERMAFLIDSRMKHSYSNDDTCLSIDVIYGILEEDFDALLDEAINIEENTKSESDEEELPFKKITFNIDYKIRISLEEPPSDLELKPLPNHLEYVFLEEPFLCMLAIFHDMNEESVEVFMDDFSVFGTSFNNCLHNLDKMLQRCKDANLVLYWKKYHFIIKEGIVLGHKVFGSGLKVDKAKINVISKLPPLLMSKGIRSFLGHAGFYRCFIKDFSKISCPLTKLPVKDTSFEFNDECHKSIQLIKRKTHMYSCDHESDLESSI